MNLKSRLIWGLAVFASALNGVATDDAGLSTATETNAPKVSLDTLVKEALERNPELNFYKAEIKAARAGLKTAGLWANPEVSGSVGHKRSRASGSELSAEGVAWSVSVMQPFEWPGRIGLRKAIANRDVELAELGLQRFRVALAGRVRVLGYGLLAAQEKAAAAAEVAERFRSLREVLVQREPAGLTPLLETRVIEATELTTQRKASAAQLAKEAALLELNQLRGSRTDEPLAVTEAQLEFPAQETKERLLALARTNNFELRVRAAELAQQGFRVALAKNERFPTISVGPSFSEENGIDQDRIAGIGVSLPLPIWNRNGGNIEAANARQLQAETSLLVSQREVERKVMEAAATYEAKVREMGRWRADAPDHFRQAAELADRHYRLGAVPVSTYLELQKQYLEAVEALLDNRKEALEAAAQLELLTGLPLPLATAQPTESK
jgi:cobalt-zinc-cadmium efflux system outer membrane protein